jgi:hypothetical protein
MSTPARRFFILSSVVIGSLGAIAFFGFWFLGKNEIARGIIFGLIIGWIELESIMWIFPKLIASQSRLKWGLTLGAKSLIIFSIIGFGILGLKISGLGFIIGFSMTVFSIVVSAVWTGQSLEGKKE